MTAQGGRVAAVPAAAVGAPRIEHLSEPVGIGVERPRVSWTTECRGHGVRQQAYELEFINLATGGRHSSGRIESDQSVLVPWPLPALRSRQRGTIRARIWVEGSSEPSPWSPACELEAGLLEPEDWAAAVITPDGPASHTGDGPAFLLRREFDVPVEICRARLYVTALGLYEIELNGRPVGDAAFTPGWTSYRHRLRYQTVDVTSLLLPGAVNAMGAWLADGWYRGRLGFGGGTRDLYGSRRGLLAQLELQLTDGTVRQVVTDRSWRASEGPILRSSLYDGETYDARSEQPGWSLSGYDESHWQAVDELEHDLTTLTAPLGPPVRCTETLSAVSASASPSGQLIVDFGQNLVGRVRLEAFGERGAAVRLRHAEVLEDGELCLRPLRHADATDEYVLRGDGREAWEPRFTFHGFRYAEVETTGDVRVGSDQLRARVYHSDMRRTGWFDSSHPLLNRFHENVVWSMRGNSLDIPTDCPQRDERLGWTGDIQVFAPAAAFLYDCAGFLSSWLRDLAVEQHPDGTVPLYVPWVPAPTLPDDSSPTAVWGDAAVLTPWVLYERFGDVGVLHDQYASAAAWVDRVIDAAGEDRVWDEGAQLGDWLDPAAPPDDPAAARADRHLVATAYYARSAAVMARTARVLGRVDDARYYGRIADEVARAFARRWVLPSGHLRNEAQTSYALAIHFGLFPSERQRRVAGDRLADLVRAEDFRIGTGFAGTPLICDALTSAGHHDTAYRLLLQEECPSWLYPVTRGATTIWERWDSLLPDGSVNPGQMTSFNHYALGAVADWIHRTVAGLAPAEPGYRRLLVQPRPGGELSYASASHLTPYGLAEVAWARAEDRFELDVLVPFGTRATVQLPSEAPPIDVDAGRHRFVETPAGIETAVGPVE